MSEIVTLLCLSLDLICYANMQADPNVSPTRETNAETFIYLVLEICLILLET